MEPQRISDISPRCFVISPIGAEGSEVREHADDVFDYIIKPALSQVGVHGYRSDHAHTTGLISQQMYDSILNDDFCIAVLTFHNPNVYYELAIAQSAARPVIILLQKDMLLPFDIKDMRTVFYDLRPRPLFEGVYAREIAEKIRHLQEHGSDGKVPFAPELTPLGGDHQLRLHFSAAKAGSSEAMRELLQQAEKQFDLCGIALGTWTKIPRLRELMKERLAAGCRIRILLMAATNPSLPLLLNEANNQGSLAKTTAQIELTAAFLDSLAQESAGLQVRYLNAACPHYMISLNERSCHAIGYLFARETFRSPLWQCKRESAFYGVFAEEFEALWEQACDQS